MDGRRAGLAGERSGLFFEFVRVASILAPRWLLIENVPGLLSSNGGRDMGTVLGALGKLGYGYAYRVLDAQYFGLAQRRKRVFIVGCLGDWRRAAQVLFEPESVSGDPAPSRETGKGVAALTANGVGTCGADDNQAQAGHLVPSYWDGSDVADTLDTSGASQRMPDKRRFQCVISHPLTAEGHDASEDGTGRGAPMVAAPLGAGRTIADTHGDAGNVIQTNASVRRLTPLECERLQGFPDGWTDGQSDSARYRQLGNAVAVPVAEWIGKRIMGVLL